TSGAFTASYKLHGASPAGITTGPDGALWVVAGPNEIDRITTDGQRTGYQAGQISTTGAITAGADGALWSTIIFHTFVGRIPPAGAHTIYPTQQGSLSGIAAGPGNALWFMDGNGVGLVTTAGALTEFRIPNADNPLSSSPLGIAAGSDGAL